MQKRNVRGAPIVKKSVKVSPPKQTKSTSPLKIIAKKVEKIVTPKRQEIRKEDKKPVKKMLEENKAKK
jgi:hypothetical protein